MPKRNRLTVPETIMMGFVRWPELMRATNQEIADALRIIHPISVSRALSKLHHEGKIYVSWTGELYPVRSIKMLEDPANVKR